MPHLTSNALPPGYRLELQLTVAHDEPALALLATASGLSKSRLKEAMTQGAVWHTRGTKKQRLRRASSDVQANDRLDLYYDADILATPSLVPVLVHDHPQYSVWHKPAGMPASGSRFSDHGTIYRWVEREHRAPAHLVHRLDQYTAGLLVIAHGKGAAAQLAQQFASRSVVKQYMAVVQGVMKTSCEINQPLDERTAVSSVTPLTNNGQQTLVQVDIQTGRKHQIRRHLLHIGHPLAGDRMYGNDASVPLQLLAWHLEFNCPATGERQKFRLEADQLLHLTQPDDLEP
ncbi:pseudouridine synthase [Pseudomonadales bacterium]|nr:pseudouridine synthase [Pseudomonadales bacterium]